jgi:hypothetical protein
MSPQPPPSTPSPTRAGLAWAFRVACLLGACAGFAAIWVILASATQKQHSWMAMLGALDVVWVMRLVGWPAGPRRGWTAMVATAVIAFVANWWIVAVQLGYAMGYTPIESAARLGPKYAWTLVQLANGPLDALMIAAALVLAAIASR